MTNTVCHCYADAVLAVKRRHCLPFGKQWHTGTVKRG
jgi:hypothetical protein